MTIPQSAAMGVSALTVNPLRTFLSALGVVIGVAALVSVMSLGAGVADFAARQIAETTDLLGVSIAPSTTLSIDGQRVRRNDIIRFTADDAVSLRDAVHGESKMGLVAFGAAIATHGADTTPRGFSVTGNLPRHFADAEMTLVAGRTFQGPETGVVVLNRRAAALVAGDTIHPEASVGRRLVLNGHELTVIGVVTGGRHSATVYGAFVPLADAERTIAGPSTATFTILAPSIEQVDRIRREAEVWAASRFGPTWRERLTVGSNRERVEQAATAMHVFRLLMGSVAGISLLVGGVGIMNVLLAAVVERTREIGVRRAVGARRRDVLAQFLAESVFISTAGAAIGAVLGVAIAFAAAAVMRQQTGAPVSALVSADTMAISAGLAVAVGIGFGLYPAVRASRLTPLDALRHE